jgi:uncharacterized protein (DUF2237 family)
MQAATSTPVQGRIDGCGPDPITGFYTLDALILRGECDTLRDRRCAYLVRCR